MYVLHAHWRPSSKLTERGAMLFWAESYPAAEVEKRSSRDHPFCADVGTLRDLLGRSGAQAETFTLLLPGSTKAPLPSQRGAEPGGSGKKRNPKLRPWNISGLRLAPVEAVMVLMEWLEADRIPPGV